MRHTRIFLLRLQETLQYRLVGLVWVAVSGMSVLMALLFWTSTLKMSGTVIGSYTLPDLLSYFLTLFLVGTFILCHIDDDVARNDIYGGGISGHLLKPYSYLLTKFFHEGSWRLMMGIGALILFSLLFLFGVRLTITSDPLFLLSAVFSGVLGLVVSFLFRMIIGVTAFWLVTLKGLGELVEILTILCGGFTLPLSQFPAPFDTLVKFLPFPYMAYYPTLILEGKLSIEEILWVVTSQGLWIVGLYIVYRFLFTKGIQSYTGVGQ